MSVSAVVLNECPFTYLALPRGVEPVYLNRTIKDSSDFTDARFDAVALVKTSHFFFLDDDDELPAGVEALLARAEAADKPLVYTDEWVDDGVTGHLVRGHAYSAMAHIVRPRLVHHLALCRTADSLRAIERLPRGRYWPEMLLYFELAKGGAEHIPQVGYIWNRRPGRMHTKADSHYAMMRSQMWCMDNKDR